MELTGPIIPAREPPANLANGASIHNASGDTSPLTNRSSDPHTARRDVAPRIMPMEMPASDGYVGLLSGFAMWGYEVHFSVKAL